MPTMYKATAVKKILPGKFKEHLDMTMGNSFGEKDEGDFKRLINHIKQWATARKLEGAKGKEIDDMDIGNVNQEGVRDPREWEEQGGWEGMWDPATFYGQIWENQEGSFEVHGMDYEDEAPPGLNQLGKGKAMDKGKGKGWGWSPWNQPSYKGWKGKGKGKGDKGGGKGWQPQGFQTQGGKKGAKWTPK